MSLLKSHFPHHVFNCFLVATLNFEFYTEFWPAACLSHVRSFLYLCAKQWSSKLLWLFTSAVSYPSIKIPLCVESVLHQCQERNDNTDSWLKFTWGCMRLRDDPTCQEMTMQPKEPKQESLWCLWHPIMVGLLPVEQTWLVALWQWFSTCGAWRVGPSEGHEAQHELVAEFQT